MSVEAADPLELVGNRGYVEAAKVVVQGVTPDDGAARQVGGDGRTERDGPFGRTGLRWPVQDPVAPGWPSAAPPVASRSSSACMKASISPSRTAPVFDVSVPVRRSLTIW